MSPNIHFPTAVLASATTSLATAAVLGALHYLFRPPADKVPPRKHTRDSASLAELQRLTKQVTSKATYPLCEKVEKNIPVYDCSAFDLDDGETVDKLQDEFYHNLTVGPGVYVLRRFFTDTSVLDAANETFATIIAAETAAAAASSNGNAKKGDHFAPASANSRIWNSFSKHALHDPESFVRYYSNPWFRIVSEAYLGPAYRITTQLNIVRPGGKAQMPHRDYHLGFQSDEEVVKWPKAMHTATAMLTLQGAVAQTDMPIQSGPTRFLPWSQGFEGGYCAFRREEFVEFFEREWVALALEKGDAVFFSPALFHAAGENEMEGFERSANLVQVSSAFSKTMETVESLPVIERTYDVVVEKARKEGMSREVEAFVCAVAEGYPFPTNLDTRPPAPGGMAPESEQVVLRRGISEGWEKERVIGELTEMREASRA